jgi:Protein of unknown function (DUF1569)
VEIIIKSFKMENIFNVKDKVIIVQRINQLTSLSNRQWGTMSVEETLWHLRCQLELALCIRERKTMIKSYLSLPAFRWLALYIIPWPKGSATAPEMNVKKTNPDVMQFDKEKELLLKRIADVEAATALGPHPLFGQMNKKLWGRLIWKHINHHLNQFAV